MVVVIIRGGHGERRGGCSTTSISGVYLNCQTIQISTRFAYGCISLTTDPLAAPPRLLRPGLLSHFCGICNHESYRNISLTCTIRGSGCSQPFLASPSAVKHSLVHTDLRNRGHEQWLHGTIPVRHCARKNGTNLVHSTDTRRHASIGMRMRSRCRNDEQRPQWCHPRSKKFYHRRYSTFGCST